MNYSFQLINALWITLLVVTVGLQAGEIHQAVDAGDMDRVRGLLEADPSLLEARDDHGDTPLNRACFNERTWSRQSDVARFLIAQGAEINTRNNFGATPLNSAFYGSGADFDLVKRLIAKGADINTRDNSGMTPILHAALFGDLETAKFLIDHGADINVASRQYGRSTALLLALTFNSDNAMARLLVESGAKLNQKDSRGNTELHVAAMRGFGSLVQPLVAHGADVDAVNEDNRTPLYYAAKHGYRHAADALIAAGAKESAIVEANYGKAPQLSATLKSGEAYLWYYPDAYAVKTKAHLLLFGWRRVDDSPEAGLANGNLNPNELKGQKITVFSGYPRRPEGPVGVWMSEFVEAFPEADWVLFGKPEPDADRLEIRSYRVVGPNESLSWEEIQVQSIAAMERGGLGYLVETDGVKIFFGGSHVCTDPDSKFDKYRRLIDSLKPYAPIDIAILRVRGHWAAVYKPYLYLLEALAPRAVYLMGGAGSPGEYPRCAEVLRPSGVAVEYPEGMIGGDRFHYLPDDR